MPIFNIKYQRQRTHGNGRCRHRGRAVYLEKTANGTSKPIAVIEQMDKNKQLSIGVPPLTLKEKASLDQLMPCNPAPTESDVSELGFRLKPSQIEAYHRFYRYYPMFGEVTI